MTYAFIYLYYISSPKGDSDFDLQIITPSSFISISSFMVMKQLFRKNHDSTGGGEPLKF